MNKKRSTYVNKKLYRNIIALERKRARILGFEIYLYYKPINWRQVKDYSIFTGVAGEFCSDSKKIKITITGRPGRAKILATLFHEMRHLDHYVLGLYKDYYNITYASTLELYDNRDPFVPKGFKLPSLSIATRAERDCNNTAIKRLAKIGIRIELSKYRSDQTLAYEIISRVNHLRLLKQLELACCESDKRRDVLLRQIEYIYDALKRARR